MAFIFAALLLVGFSFIIAEGVKAIWKQWFKK